MWNPKKESPDNVTTPEAGSNSSTASYNEIFRKTTLHQYLVPRKRARGGDETSGNQSKKGKGLVTDIINFENWTPSLEERLSHQQIARNTASSMQRHLGA